MSTGQKIRELREKRGMSQNDLGVLLDISAAAVSSLEKSNGKFQAKTLKKLAEIFGVPVESLTDNPTNQDNIANLNTVEYQRSIIDQLQEEKRRLLDIIDRLTLNFPEGNSFKMPTDHTEAVTLKLVA